MDLLCVFFCLVFVMPLCASVYLCFVITCWKRADLLEHTYYIVYIFAKRIFRSYDIQELKTDIVS